MEMMPELLAGSSIFSDRKEVFDWVAIFPGNLTGGGLEAYQLDLLVLILTI